MLSQTFRVLAMTKKIEEVNFTNGAAFARRFFNLGFVDFGWWAVLPLYLGTGSLQAQNGRWGMDDV